MRVLMRVLLVVLSIAAACAFIGYQYTILKASVNSMIQRAIRFAGNASDQRMRESIRAVRQDGMQKVVEESRVTSNASGQRIIESEHHMKKSVNTSEQHMRETMNASEQQMKKRVIGSEHQIRSSVRASEQRGGNIDNAGWQTVRKEYVAPEVDNPYATSYLAGAYDTEVHPPRWNKFAMHEKRRKTLSSTVDEFVGSSEGQRIMSNLIQDGLVINHYGMDFMNVFSKRYGSSSRERTLTGHELLNDDDVKRIFEVFYPTRVSRFFQNVDLPQAFSAYYINPIAAAFQLTTREMEMARSFRRDGFLLIDKWPDLDINEFAFGDRKAALEPMTRADSFLMRISSAYLGAEAVPNIKNFRLFTLHGNATKRSYNNAPWHFDGCGRRLKAWFYLTDVDAQTHPTIIAAGTQNNHWFPSVEYFVGKLGMNKLSEAWVDKEFGHNLHKMLAPMGGGFIFDTNSVHGAVMSGKHKTRATTLIEVSTKEHMTLPRGKRGPDDSFLSNFRTRLCPAPDDR